MTGLPGVGKTTLVKRIAEHYRVRGLRIAGITSEEVRSGSSRIGFRITNLSSGEEGWLARTEGVRGPRIGRYTVDSEDLERVGLRALGDASLQDAGLIVVDEIGPMEMSSDGFRKAVSRILNEDRPAVAVVRYSSNYPEVRDVREASLSIEITRENRDSLFQKIVAQIDEWIGAPRG